MDVDMDVKVSSRHAELRPEVRAAAVEKVGRLARFLEGMDAAEVHFAGAHNPSIERASTCEVSMRGHGHHVRAKAQAPDPLSALDAVVAKLEHQLHRLKERLVDHGHGRVRNGRAPAGRSTAAVAAAGLAGVAAPTEIPVRSKRFEVVPMTVQEAAFQMELLSHPFFVFVREDTGATAVVYHREQGGVGLIEVEPRAD